MHVVIREGDLYIEVHDHAHDGIVGSTGYSMLAWIGEKPDRAFSDAAEWGTTPLMDELHSIIVRLVHGIRPQLTDTKQV